jgi:polysaccharide biosynthesis protein PslH
MTSKPHLLYVSPVVPALTGNGLAMRAGMVLQALAERHQISLLVIPLYPPHGIQIPSVIAALCRATAVLSANPGWPKWFSRSVRGVDFLPDERVTQAGKAFRHVPFDVVHVFRLSMLPFASSYLSSHRRPRRHLDLDEIESTTRMGLAALYRLHGIHSMAQIEETEAQRSIVLEREILQHFDRVYVCSERDKDTLRASASAQVCILPNAVRIPAPLLAPGMGNPFTFLFVGTLGYFPNIDAVKYLSTDVVPLIRQSAPRDFKMIVVGAGGGGRSRQLASAPEVQIIGEVPDVGPWYRDAHAVVAPLRAGGGTRIKVLEAFSYRRPLVSTSTGIEGIDARDGEHVLVGDTPEAFAVHCVRLMTETELAGMLMRNAFSLFMRAYTPEAVARALATCAEPAPHR